MKVELSRYTKKKVQAKPLKRAKAKITPHLVKAYKTARQTKPHRYAKTKSRHQA